MNAHKILALLFAALTTASVNPTDVVLTINEGDVKEFAPFLGYNFQIVTMNYGYDNPELYEAVAALRPAYLRFPGGSAGNFYHWKTDGFRAEDFDGTEHEKWGTFKSVNRTVHPDGKIGFEDFLRLCKKLRAEPVVTLNICTETPDSAAAFAKHIKALNILPVRYGLIGCENYMPRQGLLRLPSYGQGNGAAEASEFAAVAEEACRNIKAVNADMQLAINLAGLGTERAKAWNGSLLKKKDVFDAVELHYYAPGDHDMAQAYRVQPKEASYAEQWSHMLFKEHAVFQQGIDDAAPFLPKPMWQDEGGRGWPNSFKQEERFSTLMVALIDAEYVFLASDLYPRITRVCRHSLSSAGGGWQILGKFSDQTPKKFNPHPPRYHVLRLLGAMNDCDRRVGCTVSGGSRIEGKGRHQGKSLPAITARVFQKGERLCIYVINRGPAAQKVRIEAKRNLAFPAQVEYVGGHLDGTNGIDEFRAGRPTAYIVTIQEMGLRDNTVEVVPYSLSLITTRMRN